MKDFVNGEYLLDLTKLFPQFAGKYYKKFDTDEIEDFTYNGKLIVIPHYLPQSKRICAVVRQDLIEKYNIAEIKSFEDYENYLKTIKDNEQSLISGSVSSIYNTDYIFAESYGYYRVDNYLVAKWDEPNLKIVPWEQVPEYISAISILNRWYKSEYIKKTDPLKIVNDAYNGVTSSFLIPWYTLNESYINSNTKFKFRVYPLYTDELSARIPISIEGIAFNKNSRNADRSIEFIEWLQSSQENYDLFMFGKEGTNYVLKGEIITYPSNTNLLTRWPGSSAVKNIDYIRPDTNQPENYKQIYKKSMQTKAKYTPASIIQKRIKDVNGFSKSLTPFESILQERAKAIMIFENSLTDKMSVEQTINFISRQKTLGISDFADELTRKLREYSK